MTAYRDIEDAPQVVEGSGFQVKDIGLLASAFVRPGTTVLGIDAYPDLAVKAAALLDSGARFNPLLDGNKRTAWMLRVSSFWINGYKRNFATVDAFDPVVVGAET